MFIIGLGVAAQTFNARYDMLGLSNAQTGWGIEMADTGYVAFSVSFDQDTIHPDTVVGHHTIVMTFIDEQGNLVLDRRHLDLYHGWYPGWSNCCDQTTDNGYIVGGSSNSYDQISQVLMLKLNQEGDTLWTQRHGSAPEQWIGYQVKQSSDGGYIIAGLSDAANGSNDGMVLKTDSLGNEEWHQLYGGSNYTDGFIAVEETGAGGFYLGGASRVSPTNRQMWVLRIDQFGGLLWQKKWGDMDDEPSAHIVVSEDGHLVVASGWGYAPNGTLTAPYMAKLDSADGSIIWEHEYDQPRYSTNFMEVKECPNTDLIACGVIYENITQNGLLLRTNSQGDSLWMRSYFYVDSIISNGRGRFYDVLPTPDGGFVAAGAAYNPDNAPYPPGYSQDTWVVKVDSMGCVVPGCDATGVEEIITNLKDALTIWPNPVSGGGTLRGTLELPAHLQLHNAELTLVDGQGRVVLQRVLNGASFILPLPELSSGLYYLHLSDGKRWLSGTKVLIE